MNKTPISILFMDDEPSSEIVQVAVDWLEQEGFAVDLVESMSRAIQSYYDKLYDVFILDIDMSHIPDGEEGDGVNVLKRFISLHNRTRVIMFSGAGTVRHWFAAANAHCHAYVHKNEKNSVRNLIGFIRESMKDQREIPQKERRRCPRRLLIYSGEEKYRKTLKDTITKAFDESWEIDIANSLEDAGQSLYTGGEYGIVILFQNVFELHPDEKERLVSILSLDPAPRIIVGCSGKDEFRFSILFIANHHPFRMIDTEDADWPEHFEDALKKAVIWHGQREIFKADPNALKRMHITLPEDALEDWEHSLDDLDVLYDNSENEQEDI